jgi:hypothetical protein
MPNVHEIIRDHVSLSTGCIDRLYVNGYVPTLQTGGQLASFMTRHLGQPVASPAVLRPLHDGFIQEVEAFAQRYRIPVVHFERGQRKDDIANARRGSFKAREGVVLIGVAQERTWSFKSGKRQGERNPKMILFDFSRQTVFVKHYYFYVQDLQWGPAFLKISTYLPFPVKICLNGHEWVKQQLRRERVGFEALDNGFVSCRNPDRLQEICDRLGPDDVQNFFDRWSQCLPWPLSPRDRHAGFDHRLSLWQMEVSLTQVFDAPVQGRHFFEEVIRENLDLGRPSRVSLLFPTKLNRRTPPPRFGYRTRVITDGVNPSLHIEYKRSHVKQYFKENRALRTETTINNPVDFGTTKALKNLPYLRTAAAGVNRRLLEAERLSHNCTLTQKALDRLQRPTVEDGGRASGLRFGDPRVMALLHALCTFDHVQHGFRNRILRGHVASLIGLTLEQYSPGCMTYDLRRLRLKGLIARLPHSHRYTVTTYGLRVALFCSKLYVHILRPAWPALLDEAPDAVPRPLHHAFLKLDTEIRKLCNDARLKLVG